MVSIRILEQYRTSRISTVDFIFTNLFIIAQLQQFIIIYIQLHVPGPLIPIEITSSKMLCGPESRYGPGVKSNISSSCRCINLGHPANITSHFIDESMPDVFTCFFL